MPYLRLLILDTELEVNFWCTPSEPSLHAFTVYCDNSSMWYDKAIDSVFEILLCVDTTVRISQRIRTPEYRLCPSNACQPPCRPYTMREENMEETCCSILHTCTLLYDMYIEYSTRHRPLLASPSINSSYCFWELCGKDQPLVEGPAILLWFNQQNWCLMGF